jgi:hypothetical protein
MDCPHKIRLAKILNTMMLSMGGYSFGYELGEHIDVNAYLCGALFSCIFFLHSQVVRRLCDLPDHRKNKL